MLLLETVLFSPEVDTAEQADNELHQILNDTQLGCILQAMTHGQHNAHAREAAADKAAQQLLAEEDEEAAKVAAKKAKKLRQKLKKQQQSKDSQLSNLDPYDAAASLESSMQGSGAHPAAEQSTDTSADQDSLGQVSAVASQVSAAKDQEPEAANQNSADPSSGLATSAAAQTGHKAAAVAVSCPLFSGGPSSSCEGSRDTGPAGGSPGAIHKLLCCPLTNVSRDCIM